MAQEEIIDVDPAYKKGFEEGYWLQRGNRPELDQVMKENAGGPGYQLGLKKGTEQARREAFRERTAGVKERQSAEKNKGREIGDV